MAVMVAYNLTGQFGSKSYIEGGHLVIIARGRKLTITPTGHIRSEREEGKAWFVNARSLLAYLESIGVNFE